jgi:hypothetical protein
VTIPKNALLLKQLNAFLDWLRLEEVAQRSHLAEAETDRIADGIKAEWWVANKDRFIPPSEQSTRMASWWTRISRSRLEGFDRRSAASGIF